MITSDPRSYPDQKIVDIIKATYPNNHMTYQVFVDDNFHFMDESERYNLGEFSTREEAIATCKKIVDEYLISAYTRE